MTLSDWSFVRFEDGNLQFSMSPATPLGGSYIQFELSKRFGSASGLIIKSIQSGYNGVSGITMVNSGNGQLSISYNSVDSSGLDFGVYSYSIQRLDSGSRTNLACGYTILLPSIEG